MAATPQNLLVIMSDEHNRKIAGHAGHPIVSTPALDALAAGGSCFTAAYTPSPICLPARASLAARLNPLVRRVCREDRSEIPSRPSCRRRPAISEERQPREPR
jgi:hypothetical protein